MHLRRAVRRMVMVIERRRRRRRSVIVIVSIVIVVIHVIRRRRNAIHRTITRVMMQMMKVALAWRKLWFIARAHGALNVRIAHQKRAHNFTFGLLLLNFTCDSFFLLNSFPLDFCAFLNFSSQNNFFSRFFRFNSSTIRDSQSHSLCAEERWKHVRPSHLCDDKYLISRRKTFFPDQKTGGSRCVPCAQIKVSQTTQQEDGEKTQQSQGNSASLAYLFCLLFAFWQSANLPTQAHARGTERSGH